MKFQVVSFRQFVIYVQRYNSPQYFEVQVSTIPFDFSHVLASETLQVDQNYLVADLLDPAKVTDDQFDDIFGTDLALKSVQAFSIVDDCLRSQTSTFPAVLAQLLFEYAK